MLVLTRKQGEELVIDGKIRVSVVNCGKGRVRLGVDAPSNVNIRRGELEENWVPNCSQKRSTSNQHQVNPTGSATHNPSAKPR